MERLTGLMEEVTEEEVATLPTGEPVALHPRMQDLTLKVILRTVFGLDPGPVSTRCGSGCRRCSSSATARSA